MIKVEYLTVSGWKTALRGMRNAKNSWHRLDSKYDGESLISVGPNDLKLMLSLAKAGNSHRKYLRMLHIQMDVTAPLRWWKDYDTYKVATVANGCSTMHTLHSKEFTRDMFSHEKYDERGLKQLDSTIEYLNYCREQFLNSDKKDMIWFYRMIDILPDGFMQKRTLDINYETALSIIHDRQHHKQEEFRVFCNILRTMLPYMDEIYNAAYGK